MPQKHSQRRKFGLAFIIEMGVLMTMELVFKDPRGKKKIEKIKSLSLGH